jgi:hypothetical protein|tara:strand:- start:321 stop:728 length:408 start_codon:yes stop_codon:yes gene_type:complete
MELKAQKFQSDDGLIELIVDATLTVTLDDPEGYEDWFIALEPGPWHTHPELLQSTYMVDVEEAVELYIRDILEDTLPIRLIYKDDVLIDAGVWGSALHSLEELIEMDRQNILDDERIVFRYWSGKQIAEVNPAQS